MFNLNLLGATVYGQKWVNLKHSNGEFEGLIPLSSFIDSQQVSSVKVVLSDFGSYNIEILLSNGAVYLSVAEECACNLNDVVNFSEIQVKRLVKGSAATALTVENCTAEKVQKYKNLNEYCIKCIW